jgi:hypothetical protein
MTNVLYELVIPNLFFFLAIFAIFFALQTAIVIFLEWLERKSHDWLMVFMLRVYRHYRKVQALFGIVGLLLILGAVLILSSILKNADLKPEIPFFAVVMLLVITVLYFVLTHFKGRLSLRRGSDRALYGILSLVLYLSIMLFIDQRFPFYQRYVYKNVVIPAVVEVEKTLDINKADQLLNTFRAMEQSGQCPFKNYQDGQDTNVIHNFLFVATDAAPQPARKGPRLPMDPQRIIQGSNCTDGTDTFVHSVNGAWYWVTDTVKK